MSTRSNSQSSRKNQQHYHRWGIIQYSTWLMMVLLAACASENSGHVVIDDKVVETPLPALLQAIDINTSNLEVEISFTDSNSVTQNFFLVLADDAVTSTSVTGTLIEVVPVGNYDVALTYRLKSTSFGKVELLKISGATAEIMENQTTTINFSEFIPIYTDNDGDGHANIKELDGTYLTNPDNMFSVPGNPFTTPTGLKVTTSNEGATNNMGVFSTFWADVDKANFYTVYMDNAPGVSSEQFAPGMNHANQPNEEGGFGHSINHGDAWYIAVTATRVELNSNTVESKASAELFVRIRADQPTVPKNVSIEIGNGQNTISWEPPDEGASTYRVYYATSPGVSKMNQDGLVATDFTGTRVTHPNLQNGQMYYYVVTAFANSTESTESTEVGGMPDGPLNPPKLNIPSEANERIDLSWEPLSGAVQYNLYMAGSANITKQNANANGLERGMTHAPPIMDDPTSTTFSHAGLENGIPYFFKLTAVDKIGRESALSEFVSGTPKAEVE